jgi:hypothetical protein
LAISLSCAAAAAARLQRSPVASSHSQGALAARLANAVFRAPLAALTEAKGGGAEKPAFVPKAGRWLWSALRGSETKRDARVVAPARGGVDGWP